MSAGQSVSLDALSELTSVWRDAVRRATDGQSVAIISDGEHVPDVVPAGELDRLRETIEVLGDPVARADLEDANRSSKRATSFAVWMRSVHSLRSASDG